MTRSYPATRPLKALIAIGFAAFWCGTVTAQETPGRIDQIGPAGDAPAGMAIEQVSAATRDVTTPAAPDAGSAPPVRQLSTAGESVPPPTQLTDAEDGAAAPAQLYEGGPTALPPQALSQRSEGRTGAMAPVEGEDICDPADASEGKAEVCKRVIETRSAEFVRPDPTQLSPEQRLLVQQRLREGSTTNTATRRLASEGDADTLEGLAVASVVLGTTAPSREERPVDPAKEAAADAAAALVTAIIGQTTVVPPSE